MKARKTIDGVDCTSYVFLLDSGPWVGRCGGRGDGDGDGALDIYGALNTTRKSTELIRGTAEMI